MRLLTDGFARSVSFLVLAFSCVLLCAAETAALDSPPNTLPAKTGVLISGALPNGLRYGVLPHESPRGTISLRLVVEAGALDERENEHGYAHFVEHMAFNGSRHHPPGTLRAFFQAIGVASGADLNANTSHAATVYSLDLPTGEHLEDAVELLRDYADGLSFVPEEVEREKGVILSEQRARDRASRRLSDQLFRHAFAGTGVADHLVIGTPGHIQKATPDSLRAFYRRCYQPSRMHVVVVGPVDGTRTVERITKAFASLQPGDRELPAVHGVTVSTRELQAFAIVEPDLPGIMVSLVNVVRRHGQSDSDTRLELEEFLAARILNRRFEERREKSPEGRAKIAVSSTVEVGYRFAVHSIQAPFSKSTWKSAPEWIHGELSRAASEGFSAQEVKEAVAGGSMALRNQASAFRSLASPQVATSLVHDFLAGRTWNTPIEESERRAKLLEGIGPADVQAGLLRIFPPKSGVLLVASPQPLEDAAAILLKPWESEVATPSRRGAREGRELQFAYEKFGTAGRVQSRKSEADLGLELVTFENGVQLNLRPSKLQPGRFSMRARLGRGIVDLPKHIPGYVGLLDYFVKTNELGKHSASELRRILELNGLSMSIEGSNGGCRISISGASENAELGFKLIAALVSDLRLDYEKDRQIAGQVLGRAKAIHSQAPARATTQALYLATGLDARFVPVAPLPISRQVMEDAKLWIANKWLSGPMEIGIVGDIELENSIRAASETVGTLRGRRRREAVAPGERVAFAKPAGRKQTKVESSDGVAAACIVWSASAVDAPDIPAMRLAADVLHERLMEVLREDLGATYSPSTQMLQRQDYSDMVGFSVALTLSADQSQAMTNRAISVAAELARTGAKPEVIDRVRQPRIARSSSELRDNQWWLGGGVGAAQSHPEMIERARNHLEAYRKVTAEEVNRALKILKPEALTAVIAIPAAPASKKPQQAKGAAQ